MAKKQLQTKRANATTQKFTEIKDIRENIVLLESGACIVMQITATNFALLSKDEQDAKMYAYASLLNSLSFPIQILVRSKRVQITPYLKLLDSEAQKTTNPKLALFIRQYREFVETLVTVSSVLDKQFYIIISYSGIEGGTKVNAPGAGKGKITADEIFFTQAKSSLHTKAESLTGLISRLSLRAKILEQDELIRLFYEIYNQENGNFEVDPSSVIQTAVVTKGEGV